MGLLFVELLPRHGDGGGPASAVLKCRRCRVDAASADAILSRDFRGRFGRAYLFDHVYASSLSLPLPHCVCLVLARRFLG
ncbi:Os10g0369500 [Oryza sativa Japonica Group]|uniref:Os10g0369500 protein n=1 Tax=Oryza sativa subsp. japonica TaxID=39947 RepID=A0A0P0XTB4_ORYSJ|nr:hypothetical protein EE612_050946 [Oryza sativa]BAT10550.1 Os10g0369500 [Oryza sativa Japonica Group]